MAKIIATFCGVSMVEAFVIFEAAFDSCHQQARGIRFTAGEVNSPRDTYARWSRLFLNRGGWLPRTYRAACPACDYIFQV
jgi:hypothetical protein